MFNPLHIHLGIAPRPLKRPRFNSKHRVAYQDPGDIAWRDEFRYLLKQALPLGFNPIANPIDLIITLMTEHNPTSRRSGDIDNHIKAVLDACNGFLFTDDQLVVEISASLIHSDEPSVFLSIAESKAQEKFERFLEIVAANEGKAPIAILH